MNTLESSLLERVQGLLDLHNRRDLQSTTGMQATIDELVRRNHGLEQALHEIALEVEALKQATS